MIQTIYEIGSYYLKEHPSLIEGLAVPIQLTKGKEQYIVVIDLNIEQEKVEIYPYQMNSQTFIDYRYVGSADGSNSPQWYGTVAAKNVKYLLSQTITNLLGKWNQKDSFYEDLKRAQDVFFEDLGIKKANEKRYQYVFHPRFFQKERKEFDNKKAINEIEKMFKEYLREECHISPKDVLLYSLSINGKLIVHLPEYERLFLQEKMSVFSNKRGICAVTNKEDYITGDTTKLKFKYYINDKINFASNFDKRNFYKNMAIGKEAYKNIMVGESYVLRKFNTKFHSIDCIIVPEFIFSFNDYEQIPFDDFSTHIMNLVYTVQTLDELEKLEREVEDYFDFSGIDNHVTLNFLFYTTSQASMKINKYLGNVPVNHLKYLKQKMFDMKNFGNQFFGDGHWELGLDHLFYLIPMKITKKNKKKELVEKRKILLLYESLLSNKSISYEWLINQFILLAKVHVYEQYNQYQFEVPKNFSNDRQLVFDVLKMQLLLKMLHDLKLIDKGGVASVEYQIEDEKLVSYLKEMKFNEAQSALFLLGILMARIGAAQVKRNSDNTEAMTTSNKPILNKINYQGMNVSRLQMLSTDVFEKLRQVKRLNPSNEILYAEHKRLFDKSMDHWDLSDRENVFYLLSGYSYGTKMLLSGKSKK